jgi:hypothetical protein
MNKRLQELAEQAGVTYDWDPGTSGPEVYFDRQEDFEKFSELIVADMHRKVIASILITDVVMEEKGQKPTSEDYIRAINKDFGVEE